MAGKHHVAAKIAAHSAKKRAKRLARARGEGDGPLVTRVSGLMELLEPHRQAAIQVWIDGLKATKETYDPKSREYSDQPDYKERRENANKIIEYLDGKPPELQVQLTGKLEDMDEMTKRIQSSPEAMRAMNALTDVPAEVFDVQESGGETDGEFPSEKEAS